MLISCKSGDKVVVGAVAGDATVYCSKVSFNHSAACPEEKETRLSKATAKTERRAEKKVKNEEEERVFTDKFIFTAFISPSLDKKSKVSFDVNILLSPRKIIHQLFFIPNQNY